MLKLLALQGAPYIYIYDVSRLRVNVSHTLSVRKAQAKPKNQNSCNRSVSDS
jgi:hypothetical protein